MDAGLITCPSCGHTSARGKHYCGACGVALPVACPVCGGLNPPDNRYCADCGHALATGEPQTLGATSSQHPPPTTQALSHPTESSAAVSAPSWEPDSTTERRVVTVMFADLVGSTTLGEQFDPEDVRHLIGLAHEAVAQTVRRYGGYVCQYLGDGVMVLFGAPSAHDDDAERAALAGLEMHQALAAVNAARPHDLPALQMRVGIATGEVVTGTMGNLYGASGDAVNTAARLQSAAPTGGVLVDAVTMEVARRRVRFGERQDLALKGKARPVPAFAALVERETLLERWELHEQRTPLVGRAHDLEHLHTAWQRVLAGEGQLITIVGEAGIGKSRVVAEVVERITTRDAVRILRARALSYGQHMSLWLVADLVRGLCGLREHDPLEEVQARLEAAIGTLLAEHDADAQASALDVLGEVLGLPIKPSPVATAGAQARRRWVIRSLRVLLGALGAGLPTLVILEDLHWADESSVEVLAEALVNVPGLRLLVVTTQRPGWAAPWAEWGWVERVILHPLSTADGVRLAQAVLGAPLAPPLEQYVVERAEGNPFFVEELLHALRDAGELEPQDGAVGLKAGAAERVPTTLTEVLLARLDRLEAEVRSLAQVASVIGRSFAVRLLARVVDQDVEILEEPLGRLQRAEIMFPRPSVDPEYIFKHATLREVAYATLLQRRRQALHLTVARAIADLYAAEEYVELIAYHYSKTEQHEEAAVWLERAGDYAASLYANAVAVGHYSEARKRRAVSAADTVALARIDEKRGVVLRTMARYDEALAVLDEAVAVYRAADDLESAGRTLAHIGRIFTFKGTHREGIARLEPVVTAMELGTAYPSHALAALYGALADLYAYNGRYSEELSAADRAAEIAATLQDDRMLAFAGYHQGMALALLGRPEEGLGVLGEAAARAEAEGDLATLCEVLDPMGYFSAYTGDIELSRAHFARALAVSERLGDPAWIANAVSHCGLPALFAGDWTQARVAFERGVALSRQVGTATCVMFTLGYRGWLHLWQGDWTAAVEDLTTVSALAEDAGTLFVLREAQGLLAEHDLLSGHPEAARGRLVPLLDRSGLEEMDVTRLLTLLAWAHLDEGDEGAAVAMAAQAVRRARDQAYRLALVDGLRVQAMVAIRQGQWDEATSALEEGITIAHRLPYPYAEARLLHIYGEMHVQTGKPELALQRLEAALAIVQQLGARQDCERVRQAIADVMAS